MPPADRSIHADAGTHRSSTTRADGSVCSARPPPQERPAIASTTTRIRQALTRLRNGSDKAPTPPGDQRTTPAAPVPAAPAASTPPAAAPASPAPAPRPGYLAPPPPARPAPASPAARRKLYDEVDELAARFRATGDHDVALQLADKRFDAAVAYDEEPTVAVWPPVHADPFPDHVRGTLPEIGPERLDAATVAGAIQHHGSCVVRGLFTPDQVGRTVHAIDEVMSRRTPDQVEPLEADAWYRPYEHLDPMHKALRAMVVRQGGTFLADSPVASAQVMEDLRDAGVLDFVTEHFGERPYFSLQKSTLRYSEPKHDFAGWHQDGSFLGSAVRTVNVWVALTDCGGDHLTPGLEIVPRRVDELLERDGGLGSASISDARVHATAGDTPTITPEFKAGDALIFDQKLVHRTHLFPGMELPRYALECWMFAPAHAAEEYVPLVI